MSAAAAYRQLLRVRSQAFHGDQRALDAAQKEIRAKFEEARTALACSGSSALWKVGPG
jgi:hypothetical protein